MLRIVHLFLFGLVSLVKSDQKASESAESPAYDFGKLGMGANEKEVFEDYGAVFNFFDFEEEMVSTDKLTFVYVVDT